MGRSNAEDSDSESTDDYTLERKDCGRCGGSGEIVEMVAGRSGLIDCPSCENIPESAVPNEIPDDLEGRLETIDSKLTALDAKEERYETAWSEIQSGVECIETALETGLYDDDHTAVLEHLVNEIRRVGHRDLEDVDRGIKWEREQLRDERAKLTAFLGALKAENLEGESGA